MSAKGDFWSRRRAAVQAEAEADSEAESRAEAQTVPGEEPHAGKTDEDILKDLGLPDPDTIGPGDDVKAFLQAAVPERLRRRALRALWRSNPTLANLDSLVEYGEDYTDAATVAETLTTAYQVGKGMLRHIERLAEAEEDAQSDTAPEERQSEDRQNPDFQNTEAEEPLEPLAAVAEQNVATDTADAPLAAAELGEEMPQTNRLGGLKFHFSD